jgi:hypothetical protein
LFKNSVITVASKVFLERAFEVYPILKTDINLRVLFCHIVHNMYTLDGDALLTAELLAEIEGKQKQFKAKNYVAGGFIASFSTYVLPIKLKQYSNGYTTNYKAGKARKGSIQLPLELEQLYKLEHKDFVYIRTLKPLKRESKKVRYDIQHQQELEANEVIPLTPQQAILLDYMNGLSSNKFATLRKYIPQAKVVAQSLEKEASRTSALKILDNIQLCPKPFYKPSKRGATHRIFSANSFLNLPKKVRKVFTQDWIEMDLEQAQLRVLTSLWNVKPMKEFIATGKSLWAELINYIQVLFPNKLSYSNKEDIKTILKKMIYSTCYGMASNNLKREFKESFEELYGLDYKEYIPKQLLSNGKLRRYSLGNYLINHPLLKPFLQARSKHMARIKYYEGMNSPYGWVPLEKGQNPSSVLATVAQAYEQRLMEPFIKVARDSIYIKNGKRTDKLQIMGYLHDGLFLHVKDKSRIDSYMNKIKSEFKKLKEQKILNIDISLSYSYLDKKEVIYI